jgi:hypothetical protein
MLSLYGIKDLGSLLQFIQMEQSRFNAETHTNIVRALPRKGLKEHQQKEGLSCKKNS